MDPQQFLTELDSELRLVMTTLLGAAPPTQDVTATDQSGRVSVTLRPDLSLARVDVAANWEEEVEVTTLGATILQTIGTAQSRALGVDGDQEPVDVDPREVDEALQAQLKRAADQLLAPMSDAQVQQQIDDLPGLLDQIDAQLDQAIARTAPTEDDLPQADSGEDADDSLGVLVESENHMVRVQLFGGQVADVVIRESWLEGRSGIAVTQCFDQIIDRIAGDGADPEHR